MKIDTSGRAAESLALQDAEDGAVSFDEQLAEAQLSGRKFSVEVLPDGRRAIAYFNDAELAALDAMKAQTVTRKKPWRQELDALKARLDAAEGK